MSGANGANGQPDPFAEGVWIYCVADGRNMLALVEGSYGDPDAPVHITEESLIREMMENRSLCVTLKRKYVLATVGYAMKFSTTQLAPAFLNCMITHETAVEMDEPFETHAVLHSFTFLSGFAESDRDRFRKGVAAADELRDTAQRARRSNLIAPTHAETAAVAGK